MHYSLLNTVFFNHNLDSLVYQYMHYWSLKIISCFLLACPSLHLIILLFLCLQFVVDKFNKSIVYLAVYFVLLMILAIQTF